MRFNSCRWLMNIGDNSSAAYKQAGEGGVARLSGRRRFLGCHGRVAEAAQVLVHAASARRVSSRTVL